VERFDRDGGALGETQLSFKTLAIGLLAATCLSGAAAAQAEVSQAGSGNNASATSGVTSFPAAFFADARPNTAMDMVSRLPGFVFDGGEQVRGFSAGAGNVVIDGQRPTSKQDDLEQILRRIPAGQVERIDLIRGGDRAIDMQGRTLIANIVRKKDGARQLVFALVGDWTPSTGKTAPILKLEATRERDGVRTEASIVTGSFIDGGSGDGVDTFTDNPAVRPGGTCVTSCALRLRARASGWFTDSTAVYERPLAGGRLHLNADLHANTYTDREEDYGGPAAYNSRLAYTERHMNGEVGINYRRALGSDTRLELTAIQQVRQGHVISGYVADGGDQQYDQHSRLSESILRGVLRRGFGTDLTVELSAEGAYNLQHAAARYTVDGDAAALAAARTRVDEQRADAGGIVQWRPIPAIQLEAGVHVETSTIASDGDVKAEKTLTYVKPRGVLTWTPRAGDQIRLRVEQEVGQLDFDAFVASGQLNTGLHAGNPTLEPMTSWVYEAAVEHGFWGRGDVTLTVRHSELSNVVDRIRGFDPAHPLDPSGFYDTPGNIGAGSEDSVTLDVTAPLAPFGLKHGLLKSSVTWRDAQATDPTTGRSRPISQIRPVSGTVSFSDEMEALKTSWGVDVFLTRRQVSYRYNEIDYSKTLPYVVFYAEYKPDPHQAWRLELNNLTDRRIQNDYVVFSGSRPAAIAGIQSRRQAPGVLIHLRYRHTFG